MSSTQQSKNPYTGEQLNTYPLHNDSERAQILSQAAATFKTWRHTSFQHRAELMSKAASILRTKKQRYASIITQEMGKPIKQSTAEVEKCAACCDYYAQNAADFLADRRIDVGEDATAAKVVYDPLGPILAVMPWNFPFWQVFRFAAPTIMAGNTAILKHASNVPQCALAIEEIFTEAGFTKGVFQTILIPGNEVGSLIEDERIMAVTITGSEGAGTQIATNAGKQLKKVVLELGGSDPFIILPDADLALAVEKAVAGRMINTGQSCIASKRFLVHASIVDQFIDAFKDKLDALKYGDPMLESTDYGPLALPKFVADLHNQVRASTELGALIVTGGHPIDDKAYKPTILRYVKPHMATFKEETFGPVAVVTTFESEEEAIHLSNDSRYGLGASIFTIDLEKAERLARRIESGVVFINDHAKSDMRVPFGGVKKSGYGRELSREGILEFVNTKTLWLR